MSNPIDVLPLSQHLKRLPTAMYHYVRELAATAPAKPFFYFENMQTIRGRSTSFEGISMENCIISEFSEPRGQP